MTAATCPLPAGTPAASSLAPFRGEAFSAEHLDAHFASFAAELKIVPSLGVKDRDFSARFELNAQAIATAHQVISRDARNGEPVPPEAEWLLDNYYVVE